jgi:cytochrome c2
MCSVVLASSLAFAQSGSKPAPSKKQAAAPASAAKGDVTKGKEVFETYCEICHYAETTEKKIGPGMMGLYERGKFADGKKVDDQSMRRWIEEGGKDMPEFKSQINSSQMADLIAFLRSLKEPKAERRK